MLPPDQRLRANKDFRCAYARAKSHVHPLAVIYVMRRAQAKPGSSDTALCSRIGFVVSKKQGGAAIRNRIKRRLREAVRARIGALTAEPYDVIFVGRKRLYAAEWTDVVKAIDELLIRSGLVKPILIGTQQIAIK